MSSSRQSSISVSSHFAILLHRSSVASIHHQQYFSPKNWLIWFKTLNSSDLLDCCLFCCLFSTFEILFWLRITDEGSVPEMRIWMQFDLKWCIPLSRSLFLYCNIGFHVQEGWGEWGIYLKHAQEQNAQHITI